MYQAESAAVLVGARRRSGGFRLPHVGRTVFLLGLTSLFTDVSAEMVATILPLYLVLTLGLSPLTFGLVDGVYQGAAALVRIASGFAADRSRRHKEVAALGYGLSAVCKLAFLAVGSAWGALTAIVLLDRTGKGIRTAPRDALISLSTPPGRLGTAFGVHRAMDTAGATLGPLVAFGILALAPLAFDAVFVTSFCFALIGFAVLTLFVQNTPRVSKPAQTEPVSARAAAALLREPRFRLLVVAAAGLGLATISDGFLYLGLQRGSDLDVAFFPLLYVGSALVFMLAAVPVGRLADTLGRNRVFVGGQLLLLLAYAALLVPAVGPVPVLLLVGLYYAATDGVLAALAGSLLPAELRATGLGLLVAVTSLARLAASVLFGAVWTLVGFQPAVLAFGATLALATVVAGATVARESRA